MIKLKNDFQLYKRILKIKIKRMKIKIKVQNKFYIQSKGEIEKKINLIKGKKRLEIDIKIKIIL